MHFAVAVFSNGGLEEVDMLLAPYCESDDRFFRFIDETDDVLKEWREGTTKAVKVEDGKILMPWDEKFRIEGTIGFSNMKRTHNPELFGYAEEEIPYREIYPTFDLFVTDHHEYKIVNNRCGYFGNNRGQWDWEEKGGRWEGTLVTDPGLPYESTKPAFNIKGYKFTNSARTMYVNWKVMEEMSMEDGGVPFATFAVITPDGNWHDMYGGNWRNEPDLKWDEEFYKRFVAPNWGTTVTIVDCHV